jgi:ribA/ribD-fused uncharacterized protein
MSQINPTPFGLEPVLFSNGIPSNFHPAEVLLPASMLRFAIYAFPTNEHYFQAEKVSMSPEGTIDMYREIMYAESPMEAKKLGRRVPLDEEGLRQWNLHFAPVKMLECNLAKYTQHDNCRDWLLETGIRPIVEHRPDPIWGDNMDGTGKNLLGKTLELVRAFVR